MRTTFAQRLTEACDRNPLVPPYGRGRQAWLRQQMNVSDEAVRKWFHGGEPRRAKVAQLAELLGCDELWLRLGLTPRDPSERDRAQARLKGAVNAFMGHFQIEGGAVAFPSEKDPRGGYVDFFGVLDGREYPFHVVFGDEQVAEPGKAPGRFIFVFPREYRECVPIGVIRSKRGRLQYFLIKPEMIEKHRRDRDGYAEVLVTKKGNHYVINGPREEPLPPLDGFDHLAEKISD